MAVSFICGSISFWKEMGLSAISSKMYLLWFVQVSVGCCQLRQSLRVAVAITGLAAPRFQVQHPCDFLRPFLTASSVQLFRLGFRKKEGKKSMEKLGRAVFALHCEFYWLAKFISSPRYKRLGNEQTFHIYELSSSWEKSQWVMRKKNGNGTWSKRATHSA